MNIRTVTRFGLAGAMATTLAMAALPARADSMAWTGTSYIVSQNPDTGQFQRRGVALFKNGEVASFTLDGQVLSRDPNVLTYMVKMTYTFDDGSTLRQEGQGRNEGTPPRTVQSGSGRLVGGTGRWEGVSGTTSSKGRGLTPWDSYSDFTADYTLPGK